MFKAAKSGHKEIVKILIEKGINIHQKDKYSHLASELGCKEVIDNFTKERIEIT